MAQNGERGARKLTMPVLGIGGEASWGGAVGGALSAIAEDVETLVVPGTGHWVAEAAPEALLAALSEFPGAVRGSRGLPHGGLVGQPGAGRQM